MSEFNFENLYKLELSKEVEKTYKGMKYLSWSVAYKLAIENDKDFNYEVITNENGLPYFYDSIMDCCFVKTSCVMFRIVKTMFLPVLDSNHKPMKKQQQEIVKTDKYGKKTTTHIEAITSFDINNAIMRCLAKNIALFGIGLSLYTGEDTSIYMKKEEPKIDMNKERLENFQSSLKNAIDKITTKGCLANHTIDSLNDLSEIVFKKVPATWDIKTLNDVLESVNKKLGA